ncbi:MAG: hypothetical protein ABFS32_08585 [Bacteroidota bacterium]
MNRRHRHKMLLIILFISGLIKGSHAQSRYDSSFFEVAKRNMENLVVFTDRSLYAVNESIQFSAFLQFGEEAYYGPGSKVLYAELVNSFGTSVAKGKFLITENRSSGHLAVPSSSLSGIYYLRCYTRWMRNFGPRYFAYVPIRVVNPYSEDILANNTVQGKGYLTPFPKGAEKVAASLDRHSYHVGEMVDVELSLKEGSIDQVHYGCITVVPSGTIDTSAFIHSLDSSPEGSIPFQFNFLPERKGTTLSGIVLEHSNQEPASDTRIHFSILGEEPAYFVTLTDKEGRFQVNTPTRSGYQEMFVVPEYEPGTIIDVLIDNDFTSEPLPYDPDSFNLSHDEQLQASRLSLHMQLHQVFLAESGVDSATVPDRAGHEPIYGTPEISVKIDEYINLPNMEEIIVNLIPKTNLKQSGGQVHIMIENENPMISMFPPLILIDDIPVPDMDVFLAIPPSKIDRINVIPEVYVFGEVKYGGIISITSLEGDLASIKLPDGSYFFDYAAYHPQLIPQASRYPGLAKIPDTRNTLFWMDHLELRKDSSRKVSFRTAGVPGSYIILFRGISSDGDIVHGLNYFNVE